MSDAEHGHDDVADMLGVLVLVLHEALGAPGACGKVERFANREPGKMVVNLGRVDGLALVAGSDVLRRQPLVVERAVLADLDTKCLASERLEESRAAGTGRAQNTEHLAAVHDTLKVLQDVHALGLLLAKETRREVHGAGEETSDRLLVVGHL